MNPHRGRSSFQTQALLLGRVEYGEADFIVHLFTKTHGRIAAMARGARKSQKRYQGSIEPFHTLLVEVSEASRGDLFSLKGSSIEVPRDRLTRRLENLTEAGRALGWLRRAAPASVPEPSLWAAITALLDTLADQEDLTPPTHLSAAFALRLLEELGWGLNLHACVSCGKACPSDRPSWVSPERGGLICRACGGGPFRISAKVRAQLLATTDPSKVDFDEESASAALKIAERALQTHTGITDQRKTKYS